MQFSPTSEHILLAYGRRHGSLLKSIVIDGETTSPIYTVLEVKILIIIFIQTMVAAIIKHHGQESALKMLVPFLIDNTALCRHSVASNFLMALLGAKALLLGAVYRVSDMELVRVLPSAEDEVNVACFHPFAGGGLVYGTKEGKLRVLQYDRAPDANCSGPNYFNAENMAEVE
ncbi:hypothetical protein Patl1_01670 [Pistacia atlantica]|uniref:Uncharacterized protein n=1 Tax=Pistacia atlantica TaxID=434234 RepID=A0ACC1CBW9_9ROSI|nr:hypothetical protein Patl1_01670 [Pistacia atlantica]